LESGKKLGRAMSQRFAILSYRTIGSVAEPVPQMPPKPDQSVLRFEGPTIDVATWVERLSDQTW
jgi:hypothetical protein